MKGRQICLSLLRPGISLHFGLVSNRAVECLSSKFGGICISCLVHLFFAFPFCVSESMNPYFSQVVRSENFLKYLSIYNIDI